VAEIRKAAADHPASQTETSPNTDKALAPSANLPDCLAARAGESR
jgi:hypothetical protein